MDKKQANILLLSDTEYEYQTIIDAGYKNVVWFKSILRANEYFRGREEELEKFDIMLMGSSSISNIDHYKYQNLFYSAINREEPVDYMCFFSSIYDEENKPKKFYVSYPNITRNGVSSEQFLSILNDSIPEELKGEKIEVPEIEEKEIVLPKTRADVKVLFMGHLANPDLVKQIFDEAGFTNYKYIRSNNFTLGDNIESLADYDFVVGDLDFNGSLTLLGDEFNSYLKDKGKSIYFAVYNFDYRDTNLNHYYVQALPTDNPQDKVFVEFDSMENESNAIRDIMGVVINLYTTYNKSMGDGGFPDKDILEDKYRIQYAEFVRENKIIAHNMDMVRTIKTMLEKYRGFYNRGQFLGYMENALQGLKVDLLDDGVSVAFLVGNREAVRMTFKDDDNTWYSADYNLDFYLEYLNEKGNRISPVKRTCSSSYCVNKSQDYPSDGEIKKIEALYKRVKQELEPMIEDLGQVNRSIKNCSNGKKNKRYNKKYV